MADQNNKSKTISFAGRNIDQNEFTRRARQKAADWARYQGLKGDEINDFNESLNDILAGISDGRYTVTDSGALSGKGPSQANGYDTKTGARIDDANGGNSRRRRGFDPSSNVMGYLNGIAGAMSEGSTTRSSSSRKSSKATTMQQYISDAIFGEGNTFSPEQLVRWADAHDAVGEDGKRGISGRREWLATTLGEYQKKLANGELGEISDEDLNKSNELISSILENNSPDIDKDWKISRDAPWLSHLLFRDAKYYSDETERKADEDSEKATQRKTALEAYVNGTEGATNPYEPGTEAYLAAEKEREARADEAFDEDFKTHRWGYQSDGKSFTTQVHDALKSEVFSSWNPVDVKRYLADAEGLETDDQGRDIDRGFFRTEWFLNRYRGHGKGDERLDNLGLKDYIDALPNGFRPDDTSGGFSAFGAKARSNRAILGKAALDYARNLIGNSGSQYMLDDGTYLLPQFIDWDSGKAYKIYLNGNKATASTVNIGDVLNGMNIQSPLYKTLLNEWRYHNQKQVHEFKDGGVLKAQNGAELTPEEIEILTGRSRARKAQSQQPVNAGYQPLASSGISTPAEEQAKADQERFATAQANGVKKQQREDSGKESPDGFSGVELTRIGAAAADLASIAAAYVPEYGTAAAGVLGIGSSLATMGADIADPSVSGWDVVKGLGINLGLDLASLAPGVGAGAGFSKVMKNISKLAPKLLMAFSLYQVGPGAADALGKLTRGEKMTRDDIRNLSYGLAAVAGIHNTAKAGFNRAQLRKGMPKTNPGEAKFEYKNSAGETTSKLPAGKSPEEVVAAIKKAGKKGKAEAVKELQRQTGDTGADFVEGSARYFDNILNKVARKDPKLGVGDATVNNEAYLKWIQQIRANEKANLEAVRNGTYNKGPLKGARKFRDWRNKTVTRLGDKYLNTDVDLMLGAGTWYRLPFKRGGEYQANIDALTANTENKALEDLTPGSSDNFKSELTSPSRKSAAAASESSANTTHEKAKAAESKAKAAVQETFKAMKMKGKFEDNVNSIANSSQEAQKAATKIGKIDKEIAKYTKAAAEAKTAEAAEAAKTKLTELSARRQVQQDIIQSNTQNIQAENYIKALKAVKGYTKKRDALVAAKEALANTRKRAGSVNSYLGLAGIEGATPRISDKKLANFKEFIKFMKANKQNDAQIREVLTDPELLARARDAFKFYQGGILKAYMGATVPEQKEEEKKEEKKETPTPETKPKPKSDVNWSGTLGNPKPTTETVETTPQIDGLINPTQFEGPSGWIGYDRNPVDRAITGLENAKYGLTQGINHAIYNVYAGFRGFHETPLLKHYRQWSSKPLEDQIATNNATFNSVGNQIWKSYADPALGIAARINMEAKKATANTPLALQADADIRTSVDKQNETGNENFANMHEVGERNRQGDVALSNARLKAYADYLHKMGTTAAQNMMSRQYGMAKAGILNDQRAAQAAAANDPIVSDAKNRYEQLALRKATDSANWTDADEVALKEATQNYRFANTNFINRWNATHIPTTGTPYAGYGTVYGEPEYFNFGDFSTGFKFARGGKMEAAEREKTRREYEKIFHDSMKTIVKESNKKLRSSAYAFYRKLFMHAR